MKANEKVRLDAGHPRRKSHLSERRHALAAELMIYQLPIYSERPEAAMNTSCFHCSRSVTAASTLGGVRPKAPAK